MAKKIDLTGQTFGDLTVIYEGEMKRIGKKGTSRSAWICKCICGKEVRVLTCNLRRKNGTNSCGCKFKNSKKYNFIDLTGKTFGYLKVIEKSGLMTKTRGCLWKCLCECGQIVEIPSNGLTSGNNVTCGNKTTHFKNNIDPKWIRCGEIPLSHLNAIKQNAVKRNLNYAVSPEYLFELFLSQKRKCALSGILLTFTQDRNATKTRSKNTTASLDRIDSKLGYIDGNVRWVHKDLNRLKGILSDVDFFEYCRKCINYQNELNSLTYRPTFDEYFLLLAFDVSLRSDDPDIKHGALIVSYQNHIIGTGYNATIKGADETKIPYHIRDQKRLWMIHAEENAILNCMVNPLTLVEGAKIYITGIPCVNCLQRMINFGIKEIYYAKRGGSITENDETEKMRQEIIKMSKIKIHEMDIPHKWK